MSFPYCIVLHAVLFEWTVIVTALCRQQWQRVSQLCAVTFIYIFNSSPVPPITVVPGTAIPTVQRFPAVDELFCTSFLCYYFDVVYATVRNCAVLHECRYFESAVSRSSPSVLHGLVCKCTRSVLLKSDKTVVLLPHCHYGTSRNVSDNVFFTRGVLYCVLYTSNVCK